MPNYSSKKILYIGLVILLAGGFSFISLNTFFHYTNRMDFCVSCHSMQNNYAEYKKTLHYKNPAGIQATCADCHVPKEFFPKFYAKLYAAKDIYHEIMGTVDSKEKFNARRWEMANAVWDRMRATDSRECRNCHTPENMDLRVHDKMARKKHARAPAEGKTCIDCHAGLTHTEPLEPDDYEEIVTQ
jgi:nitrate/TMAO reductase-like tetraheme cytochrome c subunit